MALRFFRCIRVLGHRTLLCSAVVMLSVVYLALDLVSVHKHIYVLFLVSSSCCPCRSVSAGS